jgi:2-polyprenyl-6-hydroxyphenyl methylase/3-demethylubiquinone-9 3-methyltransferase
MPKSSGNSTIDEEEVKKFSAIAEEWWDECGKFKPLHDINPVRIKYIKENIIAHFQIKNTTHPLGGLQILDIGCGGGLLSIPMRRLGATVTGIDPSEENIKVAKQYAKNNGIDIDFRCMDTGAMITDFNEKFDVVLNMEVVEHVADVEKFLMESSHLIKNNGLMIISTINKTIKSLFQAKIAAEYILRWMPIGTHDWHRFIKPGQIMQMLSNHNMELVDIAGMSYDLLQRKWQISDKLDVNYIACFKKQHLD